MRIRLVWPGPISPKNRTFTLLHPEPHHWRLIMRLGDHGSFRSSSGRSRREHRVASEKPLRPARFVARKIVDAARAISAGSRERLLLGRLDVFRDWDWAQHGLHGLDVLGTPPEKPTVSSSSQQLHSAHAARKLGLRAHSTITDIVRLMMDALARPLP
jgi:hypothetical protein